MDRMASLSVHVTWSTSNNVQVPGMTWPSGEAPRALRACCVYCTSSDFFFSFREVKLQTTSMFSCLQTPTVQFGTLLTLPWNHLFEISRQNYIRECFCLGQDRTAVWLRPQIQPTPALVTLDGPYPAGPTYLLGLQSSPETDGISCGALPCHREASLGICIVT